MYLNAVNVLKLDARATYVPFLRPMVDELVLGFKSLKCTSQKFLIGDKYLFEVGKMCDYTSFMHTLHLYPIVVNVKIHGAQPLIHVMIINNTFEYLFKTQLGRRQVYTRTKAT